MTYTNVWGVYGVILSVVLIFATNGIISACATAAALDKAGDKAGTAAALIGSLQYGSGIVSSVALALFFNNTPWPMVGTVVVCMAICAWLAWCKTPVSENDKDNDSITANDECTQE